MSANSSIEWTHHTFNPWWGCVRVSPGCQHCYAESFAKRVGQKVWGVEAPRRFFGDKHWAEPLKWNAAAEKAGERHRVFCASMADVFEDRRDLDEQRHRLWNLIEMTPSLDWLLLTKRPEHFDKLAPGPWVTRGCPLNMWMGTTAEDQQRADERIPALLRIPASVRFISAEPLLGPVVFHDSVFRCCRSEQCDESVFGLDWVIVGGESGHGARPCDLAWARSIVQQCKAAGVAPFVKQLGAKVTANDCDAKGACKERCHCFASGARKLRDPKGGDWDEWPVDLRVREFPMSRSPRAAEQGRG